MYNEPGQYQEKREPVRQLCRQFADEYFRLMDEKREYPEEFVAAMTGAGWLSALIPVQYGGPGLSMAEASVG